MKPGIPSRHMRTPPPLTPAHKGKGDFSPALHGANFDDFSAESGAGVFLSLVGKGRGGGNGLRKFHGRLPFPQGGQRRAPLPQNSPVHS